MASYSITGNGVCSCSGGCLYCSAARTMSYTMGANKKNLEDDLRKIDEITAQQFKWNPEKLEETIVNDWQWKKEIEKPIEKRFCHCDLWMADPVTCHINTQKLIDFLDSLGKKYEVRMAYSSSTNGLPLIRDDICEYYKEHNISIQLSHDGIGQWVRTGDFDPVKEISNIKSLIKCGTLNAVNCTTSFWNNSLLQNKQYWDEVLKECFSAVYNNEKVATEEESMIFRKLYIKINHIYDSTYDLKALNKDGHFQDKTYNELKGKPLGNMALRNDNLGFPLNTELGFKLNHVLDDYFNEMTHIGILLRDKRLINSVDWMPYRSYFLEQTKRWKRVQDEDTITGACRAFQRWKHQIGSEKSWKQTTFVIDTTGRYSECNLLDADHPVLDPGSPLADYCQNCKYKKQSECNQCGSEKRADICEYRYRWAQLLEMFMWLDSGLLKGVNNGKN